MYWGTKILEVVEDNGALLGVRVALQALQLLQEAPGCDLGHGRRQLLPLKLLLLRCRSRPFGYDEFFPLSRTSHAPRA